MRELASPRNGSTLRAAQSDNFSFKRQGMTRINVLPFSCQLVRPGRRSLTLIQPAMPTTPLAPKNRPVLGFEDGAILLT
ncbi:hypothetical protein [Collinsella sp. LCP19S3_B11]|uniref:hypothetical protein n=1 Tax=Collinsella sp. LCP19S3_B11 TaxID=3438754 RepID=UPI003F8E2F5F